MSRLERNAGMSAFVSTCIYVYWAGLICIKNLKLKNIVSGKLILQKKWKDIFLIFFGTPGM